jgi:hypothetical protein
MMKFANGVSLLTPIQMRAALALRIGVIIVLVCVKITIRNTSQAHESEPIGELQRSCWQMT